MLDERAGMTVEVWGANYLSPESVRVPNSRYGDDSTECADVAVEYAKYLADNAGYRLDEALLDEAMARVVADDPTIQVALRETGSELWHEDWLPWKDTASDWDLSDTAGHWGDGDVSIHVEHSGISENGRTVWTWEISQSNRLVAEGSKRNGNWVSGIGGAKEAIRSVASFASNDAERWNSAQRNRSTTPDGRRFVDRSGDQIPMYAEQLADRSDAWESACDTLDQDDAFTDTWDGY